MIRIRREAEAPPNLTKWGGRQRQIDCNAFDQAPNAYRSGRRFEDKDYYAKPPVKARLLAIQHGKCCYCEKKPTDPEELHVEHFRPKRGVRQGLDQRADEHPGYYWLAYEWTNLLLACPTCNGGSNKSTRFPLANPRRRARSHHDDIASERPLFIDPTSRDPRRHIRFENDLPKGITRAGRKTITGIGLDRNALLEARLKRLRQIDQWIRIISLAENRPNDLEFQTIADDARELIEQAKRPEAEFSSMALDYLSSLGW